MHTLWMCICTHELNIHHPSINIRALFPRRVGDRESPSRWIIAIASNREAQGRMDGLIAVGCWGRICVQLFVSSAIPTTPITTHFSVCVKKAHTAHYSGSSLE